MKTEELLIEDLYHALMHIESDLDVDIVNHRIENIRYTVAHCIGKIDAYFQDKEKDSDGK